MDEKIKNQRYQAGLIISILIILIFLFSKVDAANPIGPDSLTVLDNETKSSVNTKMVNISGGRIGTLDLNATIQNVRWKAFVGNVNGKFPLDDTTGSTIFDWTFATVTGRVYATRTSGSVTWASINCSNVTTLNQENVNLEHTNANDNITFTFNATFNNETNGTDSGSHNPFYVGSVYLPQDSCPTLNTYVGNVSSQAHWEEMALYDGTNTVYATIIENDETGFDGHDYDFQMIVPENGNPSFSSATAYYVYLEIGT